MVRTRKELEAALKVARQFGSQERIDELLDEMLALDTDERFNDMVSGVDNQQPQ